MAVISASDDILIRRTGDIWKAAVDAWALTNEEAEMNPQYPSIAEIILARDNGLITKKEARFIVWEYFPALKRLADAKAAVAASK